MGRTVSMRTRRTVLAPVLAATACLGLAHAAAPFEGKMRLEGTMLRAGRTQQFGMDYYVKQSKIRVDVKAPAPGGAAGYLLGDLTTKKFHLVMPAQRMAMALPTPAAGAQTPAQGKAPELTRTGKTTTVAFTRAGTLLSLVKAGQAPAGDVTNYTAEEWTAKTDADVTELWVVKDLGGASGLDMAMGLSGGQGPAWTRAKLPGFPYRIITRSGNSTSELWLTQIDTKPLADAFFRIPGGFQVMQMPMMPGMPAMPRR